ncbi:hypothetical protein [Mycolicibacter acidiphilus]|uniref:hypothetical protein n=1 Tax=Mycolicibacter acidiphilus TaxID=2835306 RepID=UPI002022C052|nr:hypothetical protein [Mycolicibacter acidiphilus]
MTTIPKPAFPSPRPRRSSIGQAAAANEPPPADTQPVHPVPASEAAVTETRVAPVAEPGPSPEPEPPAVQSAENPSPTISRGRTRRAPQKQAGQATPSTSTTASKRPVASKDILLSLPEDAKERMVNTITWTQPHTGIGQQQKFIRKAINELCDRLERDFNNGQPFPTPAIPDDE